MQSDAAYPLPDAQPPNGPCSVAGCAAEESVEWHQAGDLEVRFCSAHANDDGRLYLPWKEAS